MLAKDPIEDTRTGKKMGKQRQRKESVARVEAPGGKTRASAALGHMAPPLPTGLACPLFSWPLKCPYYSINSRTIMGVESYHLA